MNTDTLRIYQESLRLPPRSRLELIDNLLRHLDATQPGEFDFAWRRVISFRSPHWPDPTALSNAELERVRRELKMESSEDAGRTG